MANFRVEYAHRGLKINNTVAHGVQSALLTTSFNLTDYFELGQLDVYESLEELPDIQLTIEKLLDGYPLILELATGAASTDSLIDRMNQTSTAEIFIYPDSGTEAGSADATTVPVQIEVPTLYVSSISYGLNADGNYTESITLVGNDKSIKVLGDTGNEPDDFIADTVFGEDSPADTIKRRQHMIMGVSADNSTSTFHKQIPGINTDGYNPITSGIPDAKLGNISISANVGRTDFFAQGIRKPYFKRADVPIQIDCNIDVIASSTGNDVSDGIEADSGSVANLVDGQINIILTDGTRFNLGNKVKISSVTETGGSVGGEALTYQYSFQTSNSLTVTSPAQS